MLEAQFSSSFAICHSLRLSTLSTRDKIRIEFHGPCGLVMNKYPEGISFFNYFETDYRLNYCE